MTSADVTYLLETPAHDPEIEAINAEAFGPGRFVKAAYKIREGGPHERALSFVAVCDDEVIASVRMTRVATGTGPEAGPGVGPKAGHALLLGPLAVRPRFKNLGIGRKLVAIAVEAATKANAAAVILVGDEPYYGPLGFKKIPAGTITMPRPVDPNRLLILEIDAGTVSRFSGELDHADRLRPAS